GRISAKWNFRNRHWIFRPKCGCLRRTCGRNGDDMSTTRNDPDAGMEPAYAAPAHSCDAHFHVFGAAERYPYGPDLRYPPPHEPLEAYLKLARRIGFERFVFVQPSAYGFDNTCMFDAMRQMDPAVRRGIVDLDETSTTEWQLA